MTKAVTNMSGLSTLESGLRSIVEDAYSACGYDRKFGRVTRSTLPEMAQYQSNGAFLAAKEYNVSPLEIAQRVADKLAGHPIFRRVSAANPGFINIFLADEYIVRCTNMLYGPDKINFPLASEKLKIILDYGGANVAKPLHVGHLRSAIIGEAIKRIGRFLGHDIIGDVHLGDWGLQMGTIITELKARQPGLVYFDSEYKGVYPETSPVSIQDLEHLYVEASMKAKTDEVVKETARQATIELQRGHL